MAKGVHHACETMRNPRWRKEKRKEIRGEEEEGDASLRTVNQDTATRVTVHARRAVHTVSVVRNEQKAIHVHGETSGAI